MTKKSIFSAVFEKLVFLLAIILTIVSIIWLDATYKQKNLQNKALAQKKEVGVLVTPTKSPFVTIAPQMKTKDVSLHITDTKIMPQTIRANNGETVKISLFVDEGYHNFRQPEYGIASKKLTQGKYDVFAFVATQSGTFRFYADDGKYDLDTSYYGILIIE